MRLGCLIVLITLVAAQHAHAQNQVEASDLRIEQAPDGLYLSTTMRFELTAPVEEALLKGIAMSFVYEAQVFRDRWYWYDKAVLTSTRSLRLAYQPLTRRWRVSLSEGSGLGANLGQNFDTLADAMSAVRRLSRWKIADSADLEPDARHNIDFRFRLDNSQLPRPMQIGITGNADWTITLQRNLRPVANPPP